MGPEEVIQISLQTGLVRARNNSGNKTPILIMPAPRDSM